jgi:hypothetical protein
MVTEVKGQTLSPFCDCLALEKNGQIACPETSANNYQPTLCNIPKERRPQIQISWPVLTGWLRGNGKHWVL